MFTDGAQGRRSLHSLSDLWWAGEHDWQPREGGEPIQFVFEEIVWSAELSREEASRHLEVTMYPFKKVSPWLSINKLFFCITDSYLNILKFVVKSLQQHCPVKKNSICWLGMFWSMAAGRELVKLVLSN